MDVVRAGLDRLGPAPARIIGLMSGTSLDGIDAALVRFSGSPESPQWVVEAFRTTTYTAARRAAIQAVIESGDAAAVCRLHADLGEWFAAAALELCGTADLTPQGVTAIGSHGQTVWHEPPGSSRRGATLQLGSAATIAERTGIDVVHDFRARDVAAGGHGAPLVPWVDGLLFAAPEASRVLLNIGGMANLTRVPPRGSGEALLAFDTGPGNALIDAVAQLASGGVEPIDRDGALAARGRVDEALVAELLSDDFFQRTPPKSTGRERFGRPYVESLARARGLDSGATSLQWSDFAATMTALTARSIGRAIERWVRPLGADELVVTGGGARNPVLLQMLAAAVAPLDPRAGSALGVDPDAKEAVAFAALAWAHLRGVAANVPAVTGAAGPRLLGSFTPA